MKNNKENGPFYKEFFHKMEDEIGIIDTIIGLTLGATVCGLYWRHAWKNH